MDVMNLYTKKELEIVLECVEFHDVYVDIIEFEEKYQVFGYDYFTDIVLNRADEIIKSKEGLFEEVDSRI